MAAVGREAFADDSSWLEHQAILARLLRSRVERPLTAKERETAKQHNAMYRRVLVERPRWREKYRRQKAANPERLSRNNRNSYWRYVERRRADKVADYWKRPEEMRLRARMYLDMEGRRERKNAQERTRRASDPAYRAKRRQANNLRSRREREHQPGYLSAAQRRERGERVRQLHAQGWTLQSIAEQLGMRYGTVWYHCNSTHSS